MSLKFKNFVISFFFTKFASATSNLLILSTNSTCTLTTFS